MAPLDLSYWLPIIGMLPPKLRHFLGCLASSEFFFAEKVTLPWLNHILKIQWEINFFKRHFLRQNAPRKKFRVVII